MSELALSAPQTPSRKSALQREQQPTTKISGKVRAAIDAMVWQALPRKQAAEAAGISEHGLYKAFRKPPVRAAYLAELEVLRTSERSRNIHRLTEIRDAADNMPAVNAIKLLEQIDSDAPTAGTVRQAGITIVIQGTSEPRITQTIEHEAHSVNPPQTMQDE